MAAARDLPHAVRWCQLLNPTASLPFFLSLLLPLPLLTLAPAVACLRCCSRHSGIGGAGEEPERQRACCVLHAAASARGGGSRPAVP